MAFCALCAACLAADAAEPLAAAGAHAVQTLRLHGGVVQASSLKPSASIFVTPLGFTPPGALYLGQRNSLVSLDFIGEDRLLFTFRVPGLLLRGPASTRSASEDERRIRALVLHLPSGSIETEAVWMVHDRARYLWMMTDGHFLLRDGQSVFEGDASLDLKPLLHFPGSVLWIESDPAGKFLVTNSREPSAKAAKTAEAGSEGQKEEPEIVVRVLQRSSGQVLLVSHVRSVLHLPFNSEGYVEALRGRGIRWTLAMNPFTGGSRLLGQIESTCMPLLEFLAPERMLATTCGFSGERRLAAVDTEGALLWQDELQPVSIWPSMVHSANGARLAVETLEASHAIGALTPMDADEIKGQAVRVLDAATGKVLLETAASPVYDVGGNVALSPSGKRVAVLSGGKIEIFDLFPLGQAVPPPTGESAR